MAPKSPRTETEIRHDLERERTQLAADVTHLRSELRAATDLRARLGAKFPVAVTAAAATGFVVAGGIGSTVRTLTRRRT